MASNSGKPQGEYQQIDLMKLNLAQLNQLKNQLNQVWKDRLELKHLLTSVKSRFFFMHIGISFV